MKYDARLRNSTETLPMLAGMIRAGDRDDVQHNDASAQPAELAPARCTAEQASLKSSS
jgi:hypothetical protein